MLSINIGVMWPDIAMPTAPRTQIVVDRNERRFVCATKWVGLNQPYTKNEGFPFVFHKMRHNKTHGDTAVDSHPGPFCVSVSVWVLSSFSGVLPQSKDLHKMLIGNSESAVVWVCLYMAFDDLSTCPGCNPALPRGSRDELQSTCDLECRRSGDRKMDGWIISPPAVAQLRRFLLTIDSCFFLL